MGVLGEVDDAGVRTATLVSVVLRWWHGNRGIWLQRDWFFRFVRRLVVPFSKQEPQCPSSRLVFGVMNVADQVAKTGDGGHCEVICSKSKGFAWVLKELSGVVTEIAVELRRKLFQRRIGIAEAEDSTKKKAQKKLVSFFWAFIW
ncbi:hypothetical protein U1Q18_006847 [Sarracenia purpurea var. burkii]